MRDRHGTRAEITLMPPEVFSVQRSALNNTNWQIAQAALAARISADNPGAGPSVTAPNAGPDGNLRTKEGYGI